MKIKVIVPFILSMLLLAACSKKEDPLSVKEERQQQLTSKSWVLQKLTVDNVDQTSLYTGLTLHFTDTGFTAENGLPIWPSSSSWAFTDESAQTMVRDDHVELSITEITETKLVLLVQWKETTFAPGRTVSLQGEHIFTFVKQ